MLDVSAALVLTLNDEEIPVSASGSEIVVEVRRPIAAFRAVTGLLRFRRNFGQLALGLRAAGLTLTLTRAGRPFVRTGAGIAPFFLGRLLTGTPYVALFPKATVSRVE